MGCCFSKPPESQEVVPKIKPNGTPSGANTSQMLATKSPSSTSSPPEVPGKTPVPDKPVKFNEKEPASPPPKDAPPSGPQGLPPKPPEQKGSSLLDGGHLNETNQVAPTTNTSPVPQSPKMTKDASSSHPLGLSPKPPEQKDSSLVDSDHLKETYQVAPTTNTSPNVPPRSPKMTKDASSSDALGLPPKPPEQQGSRLVDGGHLKETYQVAPTTNTSPTVPPQSPKMIQDASSSDALGLPPKPPEQKGSRLVDGGHLKEKNQVDPTTNTSSPVPLQSPKMNRDASSSDPLGLPPKPPEQKGSCLVDGGHLKETNQVAPTRSTSPHVPPQSPKMTKDASSSDPLGLPPKPLEQKGSRLVDGGHLNETYQVAPTTNNTKYSYPRMPPQSPKITKDPSSSYSFGLPPMSQEPKSIGVTEKRTLGAHPGVSDSENLNQTKKGAPTTNNPTSSSPYAPPGSAKSAKDINLTSQGNLIPPQKTDSSSFDLTPQRPSTPPKPPEVKTILPLDNFGYSNPTDTRSTSTSSDMASSRSSVPWTTPKAKEIDHGKADHVSNLRKIGQSIPSQNIGNVASKHAPPRHPVPQKAPAVKKIPREERGNQKELERYNSNDYGEDGFSYQ